MLEACLIGEDLNRIPLFIVEQQDLIMLIIMIKWSCRGYLAKTFWLIYIVGADKCFPK